MKYYSSQGPLIGMHVSSNELIALEWVITHYLNQVGQTSTRSREQFELIALLRRFQGRFVPPARHLMTPPSSQVEGQM